MNDSPTPASDPRSGIGSSYDDALAHTIDGMYKTEPIRPRRPWRTVEQVDVGTAEWVDWFNHRYLYECDGDLPPAELEDASYAHQRAQPVAELSNHQITGRTGRLIWVHRRGRVDHVAAHPRLTRLGFFLGVGRVANAGVTEIDHGVCVVTGGAGFIGTATSAALAETFERVVAVDNLHPQVHERSERPAHLDHRVELVRADITDAATWDQLLSTTRPDVIVHLAAETGTGQSLSESTRHASVNVVGTAQMLDALVRHHALPSRIVLTSSRAVYGEGAWQTDGGAVIYPAQRTRGSLDGSEWDVPGAQPLPMSASTTFPAPVSVYGATKLAQENILRAWANSLGVAPVILRLQNVYGPGQSLSNPYTGILSLFCRMARAGLSIPLFEDGQVRRDFVLIGDVARAVTAAATITRPQVETVDIGSGEHQTIARAAELIAEHFGAPMPHITGQFREGDVRHAWADVTAAAEVLGWRPEYSLREGVEQLSTWIDAQEHIPEL